jgi:hypothetical protein
MSARLNARLLAQEQAEKLSAMGITAMWIPRASICLSNPPLDKDWTVCQHPRRLRPRSTGVFCCVNVYSCVPQESVGYDIYDVYDLGEFDQKGSVRTKYGTKEELKAAVNEAHKHGIVTYIDAVLNHKFGADEAQRFPIREVDSDDRTKYTTDVYDIEARGLVSWAWSWADIQLGLD